MNHAPIPTRKRVPDRRPKLPTDLQADSMTSDRESGPNIPVDVVHRLVNALQAGPALGRETAEYEQVLAELRRLFAEA